MAETLAGLAPRAGEYKAILAIENCGMLAHSGDLWYVVDSAGAWPRVCWNSDSAQGATDGPSVALPRLARSLELIQLASPNAPLVIELLKGLAFDGWLCVSAPSVAGDAATGASPADWLPAAAALVRQEWNKPVVPLTAYKGDKNAPRLPRRAGVV
jgi:hypothetical protein